MDALQQHNGDDRSERTVRNEAERRRKPPLHTERRRSMTKIVYETVFRVTRTANNGNEIRHAITVYSEPFDKETGRFIPTQERAERGKKSLEEEHYYNIEFVSCRSKKVICS